MVKANRIVLLLVLLTLGGVVVFWLLSRSPSTGIDLFVSPTNSSITLDGKSFSAGKKSVAPGKYALVVKHDSFLTTTQEVVVKQGQLTKLAVALDPDGIKGEQWLLDHPNEASLREKVMSPIVSEQANKLTKSMPIVTELPHIDNFYRVDYGASKKYPNDKAKIALYVRYYTPDGRAQADEWLVFKGVSLDKTEVIYLDMQNLD